MTNEESIESRIRRTLERLGYGYIRIEHLGDGDIKLIGLFVPPVDRVILVDAVQTVPGVRFVSLEADQSVRKNDQ